MYGTHFFLNGIKQECHRVVQLVLIAFCLQSYFKCQCSKAFKDDLMLTTFNEFWVGINVYIDVYGIFFGFIRFWTSVRYV